MAQDVDVVSWPSTLPPQVAGEAHIGQVGGHSAILDVTLSLDTSAYVTGDVLAAAQEITNAVRANPPGTALFDMIQLLDEDDQGGALELLFFDSNVDIGTENAAYAITDTEARSLLGWVEVVAADWKDWGDYRTATLKRGDAAWKLDIVKPATGTSLWVAAISRDSKTYTAAGLKLKIHEFQD